MNGLDQRTGLHRLLRRLARWLAVAAVVISPWLFGSAEPWAYLLMCLLADTAAVLWLLSLDRDETVRMTPAAWAAAGLFALTLLQMTPLPRAVVEVAAPASAALRAEGRRVLAEIDEPDFPLFERGKRPAPFTLSAAPGATRQSLYLLLAYTTVFVVLVETARRRERIRAVGIVVVVTGFVMAVFAIVQSFSTSRAIYWFHWPELGGTVFGPFTNRNHFAAHMNMAIGVALGLLLERSRALAARDEDTWWKRFMALPSADAGQMVLLAFAAAVMGASVFLSMSRGGIAALVAAGGLAAAYVVLRGSSAARGRGVLAAVALLVLAVVAWIGWKPVAERLGSLVILATDPLRDTRFLATLATLGVWRQWPVLGSGFGTFQYVFPLSQTPELQFGRFLHAHNDYAELLADGGLAGLALVLWLGVLLLGRILHNLSRVSEERRLLAGGFLVGLLAMLIHSTVDFGLHKPANGLLFAALSALLVSTLGPRMSRQDFALRRARSRSPELPLRLLVPLGIALVAVAGWATARQLDGEFAFARFKQWAAIADKAERPADLNRAVRAGEGEASIVLSAARDHPEALLETAIVTVFWTGNRGVEPKTRIRLAAQAARAAALAARAAPSYYEYWLWLARAEAIRGHKAAHLLCARKAQELAPPGMELRILKRDGH